VCEAGAASEPGTRDAADPWAWGPADSPRNLTGSQNTVSCWSGISVVPSSKHGPEAPFLSLHAVFEQAYGVASCALGEMNIGLISHRAGTMMDALAVDPRLTAAGPLA
jgi:hypothetical protein